MPLPLMSCMQSNKNEPPSLCIMFLSMPYPLDPLCTARSTYGGEDRGTPTTLAFLATTYPLRDILIDPQDAGLLPGLRGAAKGC